MHKRFSEIYRKWQLIVKKAKSQVSSSDKFVFFNYAGDISMSAEIANYLRYIFPEKYVFVAYAKGARVNISARGNNVKDIVLKAIAELENATGGGHENAVGAQISKDDLEKFKKIIEGFFK
jgi:single-stranded DNA-specific DHH superfamily exonuclease